MKATARSYFWWRGLDKAIEDLVRSCSACQALRSAPAAAPLHPWVWPDAPWKRIHVDFAGPFRGKTYFIIVDAHSKWPEVVTMSATTSQHIPSMPCEIPLLSLRSSRTAGVRQWTAIYLRRVCAIPEGPRDQAHSVSSLPSLIEWAG